MSGRGTFLKFVHGLLFAGAAASLLACAGGGLSAGPGGIGGPSLGGVGGVGNATSETGSGTGEGDGNENDDSGIPGNVVMNTPLDGGVIGPPIYDYPGHPPQVAGRVEIVCKTPGHVRLAFSGSAVHDRPYDEEGFVAYDAGRILRVTNLASDECLEVKLGAAHAPEGFKSGFQFEMTAAYPIEPGNFLFQLAGEGYVHPRDKDGEGDCGDEPVLQKMGQQVWGRLFSIGLFFKVDFEAQWAAAPSCIELSTAVSETPNL